MSFSEVFEGFQSSGQRERDRAHIRRLQSTHDPSVAMTKHKTRHSTSSAPDNTHMETASRRSGSSTPKRGASLRSNSPPAEDLNHDDGDEVIERRATRSSLKVSPELTRRTRSTGGAVVSPLVSDRPARTTPAGRRRKSNASPVVQPATPSSTVEIQDDEEEDDGDESEDSPKVEPLLANRPKRQIIPKSYETTAGISWREETEIQRALLASLHHSKTKGLESAAASSSKPGSGGENSPAASSSTNSKADSASSFDFIKPSNGHHTPPVVDSQAVEQKPKNLLFKSHVRAQRKFAQGSRPSSPSVSPMKEPSSSGRTPVKHGLSSSKSNNLPLKPTAKTEDFITFLCLRGTPYLPPHLEFFNYCESEALVSCPTTPKSSRPATPANGGPGAGGDHGAGKASWSRNAMSIRGRSVSSGQPSRACTPEPAVTGEEVPIRALAGGGVHVARACASSSSHSSLPLIMGKMKKAKKAHQKRLVKRLQKQAPKTLTKMTNTRPLKHSKWSPKTNQTVASPPSGSTETRRMTRSRGGRSSEVLRLKVHPSGQKADCTTQTRPDSNFADIGNAADIHVELSANNKTTVITAEANQGRLGEGDRLRHCIKRSASHHPDRRLASPSSSSSADPYHFEAAAVAAADRTTTSWVIITQPDFQTCTDHISQCTATNDKCCAVSVNRVVQSSPLDLCVPRACSPPRRGPGRPPGRGRGRGQGRFGRRPCRTSQRNASDIEAQHAASSNVCIASSPGVVSPVSFPSSSVSHVSSGDASVKSPVRALPSLHRFPAVVSYKHIDLSSSRPTLHFICSVRKEKNESSEGSNSDSEDSVEERVGNSKGEAQPQQTRHRKNVQLHSLDLCPTPAGRRSNEQTLASIYTSSDLSSKEIPTAHKVQTASTSHRRWAPMPAHRPPVPFPGLHAPSSWPHAPYYTPKPHCQPDSDSLRNIEKVYREYEMAYATYEPLETLEEENKEEMECSTHEALERIEEKGDAEEEMAYVTQEPMETLEKKDEEEYTREETMTCYSETFSSQESVIYVSDGDEEEELEGEISDSLNSSYISLENSSLAAAEEYDSDAAVVTILPGKEIPATTGPAMTSADNGKSKGVATGDDDNDDEDVTLHLSTSDQGNSRTDANDDANTDTNPDAQVVVNPPSNYTSCGGFNAESQRINSDVVLCLRHVSSEGNVASSYLKSGQTASSDASESNVASSYFGLGSGHAATDTTVIDLSECQDKKEENVRKKIDRGNCASSERLEIEAHSATGRGIDLSECEEKKEGNIQNKREEQHSSCASPERREATGKDVKESKLNATNVASESETRSDKESSATGKGVKGSEQNATNATSESETVTGRSNASVVHIHVPTENKETGTVTRNNESAKTRDSEGINLSSMSTQREDRNVEEERKEENSTIDSTNVHKIREVTKTVKVNSCNVLAVGESVDDKNLFNNSTSCMIRDDHDEVNENISCRSSQSMVSDDWKGLEVSVVSGSTDSEKGENGKEWEKELDLTMCFSSQSQHDSCDNDEEIVGGGSDGTNIPLNTTTETKPTSHTLHPCDNKEISASDNNSSHMHISDADQTIDKAKESAIETQCKAHIPDNNNNGITDNHSDMSGTPVSNIATRGDHRKQEQDTRMAPSLPHVDRDNKDGNGTKETDRTPLGTHIPISSEKKAGTQTCETILPSVTITSKRGIVDVTYEERMPLKSMKLSPDSDVNLKSMEFYSEVKRLLAEKTTAEKKRTSTKNVESQKTSFVPKKRKKYNDEPDKTTLSLDLRITEHDVMDENDDQDDSLHFTPSSSQSCAESYDVTSSPPEGSLEVDEDRVSNPATSPAHIQQNHSLLSGGQMHQASKDVSSYKEMDQCENVFSLKATANKRDLKSRRGSSMLLSGGEMHQALCEEVSPHTTNYDQTQNNLSNTKDVILASNISQFKIDQDSSLTYSKLSPHTRADVHTMQNRHGKTQGISLLGKISRQFPLDQDSSSQLTKEQVYPEDVKEHNNVEQDSSGKRSTAQVYQDKKYTCVVEQHQANTALALMIAKEAVTDVLFNKEEIPTTPMRGRIQSVGNEVHEGYQTFTSCAGEIERNTIKPRMDTYADLSDDLYSDGSPFTDADESDDKYMYYSATIGGVNSTVLYASPHSSVSAVSTSQSVDTKLNTRTLTPVQAAMMELYSRIDASPGKKQLLQQAAGIDFDQSVEERDMASVIEAGFAQTFGEETERNAEEEIERRVASLDTTERNADEKERHVESLDKSVSLQDAQDNLLIGGVLSTMEGHNNPTVGAVLPSTLPITQGEEDDASDGKLVIDEQSSQETDVAEQTKTTEIQTELQKSADVSSNGRSDDDLSATNLQCTKEILRTNTDGSTASQGTFLQLLFDEEPVNAQPLGTDVQKHVSSQTRHVVKSTEPMHSNEPVASNMQFLNSQHAQENTQTFNSQHVQENTQTFNSQHVQENTQTFNSQHVQENTQPFNSQHVQENTQPFNHQHVQENAQPFNSQPVQNTQPFNSQPVQNTHSFNSQEELWQNVPPVNFQPAMNNYNNPYCTDRPFLPAPRLNTGPSPQMWSNDYCPQQQQQPSYSFQAPMYPSPYNFTHNNNMNRSMNHYNNTGNSYIAQGNHPLRPGFNYAQGPMRADFSTSQATGTNAGLQYPNRVQDVQVNTSKSDKGKSSTPDLKDELANIMKPDAKCALLTSQNTTIPSQQNLLHSTAIPSQPNVRLVTPLEQLAYRQQLQQSQPSRPTVVSIRPHIPEAPAFSPLELPIQQPTTPAQTVVRGQSEYQPFYTKPSSMPVQQTSTPSNSQQNQPTSTTSAQPRYPWAKSQQCFCHHPWLCSCSSAPCKPSPAPLPQAVLESDVFKLPPGTHVEAYQKALKEKLGVKRKKGKAQKLEVAEKEAQCTGSCKLMENRLKEQLGVNEVNEEGDKCVSPRLLEYRKVLQKLLKKEKEGGSGTGKSSLAKSDIPTETSEVQQVCQEEEQMQNAEETVDNSKDCWVYVPQEENNVTLRQMADPNAVDNSAEQAFQMGPDFKPALGPLPAPVMSTKVLKPLHLDILMNSVACPAQFNPVKHPKLTSQSGGLLLPAQRMKAPRRKRLPKGDKVTVKRRRKKQCLEFDTYCESAPMQSSYRNEYYGAAMQSSNGNQSYGTAMQAPNGNQSYGVAMQASNGNQSYGAAMQASNGNQSYGAAMQAPYGNTNSGFSMQPSNVTALVAAMNRKYYNMNRPSGSAMKSPNGNTPSGAPTKALNVNTTTEVAMKGSNGNITAWAVLKAPDGNTTSMVAIQASNENIASEAAIKTTYENITSESAMEALNGNATSGAEMKTSGNTATEAAMNTESGKSSENTINLGLERTNEASIENIKKIKNMFLANQAFQKIKLETSNGENLAKGIDIMNKTSGRKLAQPKTVAQTETSTGNIAQTVTSEENIAQTMTSAERLAQAMSSAEKIETDISADKLEETETSADKLSLAKTTAERESDVDVEALENPQSKLKCQVLRLTENMINCANPLVKTRRKRQAKGIGIMNKTSGRKLAQPKTVAQTETSTGNIAQTVTSEENIAQTMTSAERLGQAMSSAEKIETDINADKLEETETSADKLSLAKTTAGNLDETKTSLEKLAQTKAVAEKPNEMLASTKNNPPKTSLDDEVERESAVDVEALENPKSKLKCKVLRLTENMINSANPLVKTRQKRQAKVNAQLKSKLWARELLSKEDLQVNYFLGRKVSGLTKRISPTKVHVEPNRDSLIPVHVEENAESPGKTAAQPNNEFLGHAQLRVLQGHFFSQRKEETCALETQGALSPAANSHSSGVQNEEVIENLGVLNENEHEVNKQPHGPVQQVNNQAHGPVYPHSGAENLSVSTAIANPNLVMRLNESRGRTLSTCQPNTMAVQWINRPTLFPQTSIQGNTINVQARNSASSLSKRMQGNTVNNQQGGNSAFPASSMQSNTVNDPRTISATLTINQQGGNSAFPASSMQSKTVNEQGRNSAPPPLNQSYVRFVQPKTSPYKLIPPRTNKTSPFKFIQPQTNKPSTFRPTCMQVIDVRKNAADLNPGMLPSIRPIAGGLTYTREPAQNSQGEPVTVVYVSRSNPVCTSTRPQGGPQGRLRGGPQGGPQEGPLGGGTTETEPLPTSQSEPVTVVYVSKKEQNCNKFLF